MKLTADEKHNIVSRYQAGASVATLCAELSIPRSTIYSWIKAILPASPESNAPTTLKEIDSLKRKLQKAENMIAVLKTVDCSTHAPMSEKLAALESLYGQYSVHALCEALDVPRGTFYNHIYRNKRENTSYLKKREEMRERIKAVFDESHQIFGPGKIRAILLEEGYHISESMVTELMREMGLYSIRTQAKSNYEKWEKGKSRNLLKQQFRAERANTIWVSDITYYSFHGQFYYICVIIDLSSRMVIACKISKRISTQLVTATFKAACDERKPPEGMTFHSDRGVQYTSKTFVSLLQQHGAKQSLSAPGKPHDNAVSESFFATLKKEGNAL